MKLITFAIPCYNSAAYMSHCIDSILEGAAGEDFEIILVDDGSTDDTAAIADRYAAEYPGIIRAIHQPNGGHGEGVNQGIRNAQGLYYKVVDSDDWLDVEALKGVLTRMRGLMEEGREIDLFICNYVYEHVEDDTRHAVHYSRVFPKDRPFSWDEMGRWKPSQYLLMHSVIYRTQLLRDCGLELPRHTFYVDNIFVYQPLPLVKSIYYMDVDLYRYFIGRADQSVNEQVMVKRVDQQLRVTRIMMKSPNLEQVAESQPRLAKYMKRYLSMMLLISSIFLLISGTEENRKKRDALWDELKAQDYNLYRKMRYRSLSLVGAIRNRACSRVTVGLYRVARKIYKFN